MIYKPDWARGLEVFVDADFAGGWDPEDAENADSVYFAQDLLFVTSGVQCSGRANYKQRLLFQLLRQNAMLYHRL
jgi:hypothetical protein